MGAEAGYRHFRSILSVFTVFACLSISQWGWAEGNDSSPESSFAFCLKIFEHIYHYQYKELHCFTNTQKLLGHFQKVPGFDWNKAKVLIIYDEKGKFLDPVAQRMPDWDNVEEQPVRWRNHVVVEYDGKIFDSDFTDEPRVIATRDHLEKQFFFPDVESERAGTHFVWFPAKTNKRRLEDLRVQEIPARDYLDNFNKGFYVELSRNLHLSFSRYPPRPLRDYLDNPDRLASPPRSSPETPLSRWPFNFRRRP